MYSVSKWYAIRPFSFCARVKLNFLCDISGTFVVNMHHD